MNITHFRPHQRNDVVEQARGIGAKAKVIADDADRHVLAAHYPALHRPTATVGCRCRKNFGLHMDRQSIGAAKYRGHTRHFRRHIAFEREAITAISIFARRNHAGHGEELRYNAHRFDFLRVKFIRF